MALAWEVNIVYDQSLTQSCSVLRGRKKTSFPPSECYKEHLSPSSPLLFFSVYSGPTIRNDAHMYLEILGDTI